MTLSSTQASTDLLTFARWIAADFSNGRQAAENPTQYAHIHVFFRPLPWDFFNGIGFYSEQAYDYNLWSPYRQGVHRFVMQEDRIFIENYALDDPMLYAGSSRELDILKTITPECLERRYHCSMIFRRDGDRFLGEVEPGNRCIIPRNGHQTYLVSKVELTETTWVSLDRGFDIETDQHIWGSAAGALKFEKVKSFADEVPVIN